MSCNDTSRSLYETEPASNAPKVDTVTLSSGAIVRGVFSEAEGVLLLTLEHDYPDLEIASVTFQHDSHSYGIAHRDGRVLTCEA